jgi:hypothetical protein
VCRFHGYQRRTGILTGSGPDHLLQRFKIHRPTPARDALVKRAGQSRDAAQL